ncbi:unnamed protein product [Heligmosomoides polygyrus]|uniref:WH2 domain-containing protein n=1 Tax=Heligmosomoides polygyrus TaxID=6339 RepID=A0A183FTC2_HELPZ|nr:unnamed protein product [Heligmosomoides polygyrus]
MVRTDSISTSSDTARVVPVSYVSICCAVCRFVRLALSRNAGLNPKFHGKLTAFPGKKDKTLSLLSKEYTSIEYPREASAAKPPQEASGGENRKPAGAAPPPAAPAAPAPAPAAAAPVPMTAPKPDGDDNYEDIQVGANPPPPPPP